MYVGAWFSSPVGNFLHQDRKMQWSTIGQDELTSHEVVVVVAPLATWLNDNLQHPLQLSPECLVGSSCHVVYYGQ